MAPAPVQLRIRVLGALAVEGVEGRELGSRKARVLLAALAAATDRPVPAAVLQEVVWPEGLPARPGEQLQVLVSRLRRTLGGERIVRTDAGYRLVADWLDLAELGAQVGEADKRLRAGAITGARAAAMAAVELARGPIVPDVDDPWFDEARSAAERLVARAHELLAEASLAAGDPVTAALAAEAVLDRDGYDESALRLLMRAHVAAGRPASALAAYARVRARLGEELGVDPTSETEALHTSILLERAGPLGQLDPEPVRPAAVPTLLVGRDRELARLREALDWTAAGPTLGLVVEGEAGIGKTTLVEAFIAEARRRGAVVLTGFCDPLARDLPLQPVLEAVGEHARRLGAVEAMAWFGAEAARLARVLDGNPPTGEVDVPISSPGTATLVDDGSTGRASLFRDLLAVVSRLATELPAVLVVEDLHLADAATADFLQHALRRGSRLLVLATRRPEGPGDLAAGDHLVLAPLGIDDARKLVGERADELLGRSGGNPLFLLQLADAAPGELPRSVVEAVQRRADDLGDGAPVLAAVAALGPRVDLDLLSDVLGLPVGTLLDHLDRALRSGFLADDGSELRFAHEVVREALSATLTSARRAHLHRSAAQVLVARPTVDPVEVVWHARSGGDDELAASALVVAAATAAARFEAPEVERLLSQAIELSDGVHARLLRARTRIASLDLDRAADDVARAIELGGGPTALETAGWVAYYRRDYDEARRCAEEGAARTLDPAVRASCLALAGRCRHSVGELAAAAVALEEAVGSGPASTRPVAQVWLAALRNHQGDPAKGLELAAAGVIDPTAVGHPFGLSHGLFAEALAHGMLGRPLEALAVLDRLVAVVESTAQSRRFLAVAANTRGWVLRWLGAFDEADGWNRQAAELPLERSTAEYHYVGVLDLVEGRLLAGDTAGASSLLGGISEIEDWVGSMSWRQRDRSHLYRARLALAAGDPRSASELALAVAEGAGTRGSRRHELLARAVAAVAVARSGLDPDRSAVLAVLDALPSVAGLEAWWYTAEVAAALDDEQLRRRASSLAASLAAAAGERGPRLLAWSAEVLDRA
jgi:DNA-binding SARP family transcriptional activator/tetratricopeptide (TPR) repeat protein